ncbi:hypothetical protein [Escherichia coli]|uniref:hypothetical protein n=1 Tax=Escherichia coli TaxID=562 RepID=UPI002808726D|nr:hypothetical protein [Escherichia coli]EIJ2631177.1 hypothetical protein [Escherichia coli]EJW8605379.1 hypothetical protein [Escherichia coli]EKG7048919.1 hypothetical protein [Escherichia coli]ELA5572285.1 hypothetical protein [Escherichia coli]
MSEPFCTDSREGAYYGRREDGKSLEGEDLGDVAVVGVVTWLVNRTRDDEAPVM